MKTPEQMIDNHRAQADRCLANIRSPAIFANPPLLALNYRLAHQSSFAVAILQWRFSLADPRPYLRESYEICRAAIEALPGLSFAKPLVSRFRFYDTVHLAVLLGETAGKTVSELQSKADIHTALDCALALAIATNEPSLLAAAVAQHEFPPRLTVYQRTYQTYEKLLEGDSSLIASAEDNYKGRARDNYYSQGFLIDGGGPYNAVAVDYRLAAVIKARALSTSSMHRLP